MLDTYEKSYMANKLVIATSRGNDDLLSDDGTDISARNVESGVHVGGPLTGVRTKTVSLRGAEPWYKSFHNYTFSWTPGTS